MDKFIKRNEVDISSCEMKYLDLHMSLGFFSFIFSYHL